MAALAQTPGYRAPEVMAQVPQQSAYYSIVAGMRLFGRSVFELLEGRPLTRGVRTVVEDIAGVIGLLGQDKPRLLQTRLVRVGKLWRSTRVGDQQIGRREAVL